MSGTVIVTGASRGIGKACALAFGKNGADVIVNYTRSKEKAEELCEEISKLGGRALPFCADVADRKDVDEMIAFAHSNFGSINTLVNNAGIAEQLGKDIRAYCPDLEHLVVIFNPADITGLVALLYSGLKPSQVTTLAALDSTRLRSELAKHFRIAADRIVNSRTYGGHGEQMAVFASTTRVDGQPLDSIIGTDRLPLEEWDKIRLRVVQGGKNIIDLRGRSSFQSPAYLSIEMIAAAMGGPSFTWPVGVYVDNDRFNHIMMAMETTLDRTGVHIHPVQGTPAEEGALEKSYRHLCDMRQEVIDLGILPPVDKWHDLNPNIK